MTFLQAIFVPPVVPKWVTTVYARYSVGRNQKEAAGNESCNLPVRRREYVTAEVTNLSQRSIRYRRLFISRMRLTRWSLWLSALFVGDTPRQRISIDGPQFQYMARPRHCQQVTCGQVTGLRRTEAERPRGRMDRREWGRQQIRQRQPWRAWQRRREGEVCWS